MRGRSRSGFSGIQPSLGSFGRTALEGPLGSFGQIDAGLPRERMQPWDQSTNSLKIPRRPIERVQPATRMMRDGADWPLGLGTGGRSLRPPIHGWTNQRAAGQPRLTRDDAGQDPLRADPNAFSTRP